MTIAANQRPGLSVTSGRLGALLDKLLAVDLDLEPISSEQRESVAVLASPIAITDAYDILHAAIADLRNCIHEVDGMMNLHDAAPAEIQ